MDFVLQLFFDHHIRAKQSKCVFGKKEVEYLKNIVSAQEIRIDPTKIDVMKTWPHP